MTSSISTVPSCLTDTVAGFSGAVSDSVNLGGLTAVSIVTKSLFAVLSAPFWSAVNFVASASSDTRIL